MFALTLVFAGVTLAGSGLGKLTARGSADAFLRELGVPRRARTPAGFVLGFVELCLGVLLFLGLAIRWSTLAGALLAVGFLAAHLTAQLRGGAVSCRCFGAIDTDLHPAISLARSAAFVAVMLPLAISLQLGNPPAGASRLTAAAVAGGVMSGLTYILVFHLINEVKSLVRRDRQIHEDLVAEARQLAEP